MRWLTWPIPLRPGHRARTHGASEAVGDKLDDLVFEMSHRILLLGAFAQPAVVDKSKAVKYQSNIFFHF